MKPLFFNPRVGKHYDEGWGGYRTLVLGVHLICLYDDCPAYGKCTSWRSIHGMSECLKIRGYKLRDSNILEMEPFLDPVLRDAIKYPTHTFFTCYMLNAEDQVDKQQTRHFWEHVAFFNFFQEFSRTPAPKPYKGNEAEYHAQISALKMILERLRPEIIYAWTRPLHDALAASRELRELGLRELDITEKLHGLYLSKFSYQTETAPTSIEKIQAYLLNRLEGQLSSINESRLQEALRLEEALYNCTAERFLAFSNGELVIPSNKSNPFHSAKHGSAIVQFLRKYYGLSYVAIEKFLVKYSPKGGGKYTSLRQMDPADKDVREEIKRLFLK